MYIIPKKHLPRVISPLSQKQNLVEDVRQIFAGFVMNIEDDKEITARISDITDPSKPDEEIVFGINEIDERELSLVELGAQFYWHIGYREGRNVSRQRFSIIRFRIFPQWTEGELESSEKIAQEYAKFFKDAWGENQRNFSKFLIMAELTHTHIMIAFGSFCLMINFW